MTDKRVDLQLNCGRCDSDGSLIIDIRVQTRSSRLAADSVENGRLKLHLTAPPVDGKANQQAIKLLAKSFGVAPSHVELIRGKTSRDKSFRITNAVRIPPIALADEHNLNDGET
ncbi:MAG: DUF167 domain-containing protein [Gammaproteobacteria bacterium]|jgi:hypothetical protein|nr:DUF167 domain-containing protein [Gammaproteobacteria bacterium]